MATLKEGNTVAQRPKQTDVSQAIAELGLEPYVLDIELQGYAVVPPDVTGVTDAEIDRLTQLLLDKSEELVGCRFSVADGPECELDYGNYRGTLELFSKAKPSQFQLMQLCTFDRAFRDLAVNPVATALTRHMIGPLARFSSHNCFVKWAGDGYGESLGLHCDQTGRSSALGPRRAERQLHVVPDRLHPRRRGIRVRTRIPSALAPANHAGGCQGGDSRRVSPRVIDSIPRSTLARRVSTNHAGLAGDDRQLFPTRVHPAAGRHPQPLSAGVGGRLRGPGPVQGAGWFREPVPVPGASCTEGGSLGRRGRLICRMPQARTADATEPMRIPSRSPAK